MLPSVEMNTEKEFEKREIKKEKDHKADECIL